MMTELEQILDTIDILETHLATAKNEFKTTRYDLARIEMELTKKLEQLRTLRDSKIVLMSEFEYCATEVKRLKVQLSDTKKIHNLAKTNIDTLTPRIKLAHHQRDQLIQIKESTKWGTLLHLNKRSSESL